LDGAIPYPDHLWIFNYLNSYGIPIHDYLDEYWLAGTFLQFELPEGAIRPRRERIGFNVYVYGCGLVLDCEDKLWIFFTSNGNLLGEC
jgi:hypothetical protein